MYKMIISASDSIEMNKICNTVSKSIKKRFDGAYKYKKSSNICELWSTILYQIPKEVSDRYDLDYDTRKDVKVMDVLIHFTSYSGKLRIEVTELSPNEKTIGFKTFKQSIFNNMQKGVQSVYDFIKMSIEAEFNGYDILF